MSQPKQSRPEADDSLDELVFTCLESMESSGDSALEEVCRSHPEEAHILRVRVKALVEAGLVGKRRESFPERLGDFRLLERLGEGGMGVVYLAQQESIGRKVALKLLRPDQLYFAGARERFLREVAMVGRMSHSGIVPVYAVGEENGMPYLAMEHVAGRTLEQLITSLRERNPTQISGHDLRRLLGAEDSEPTATPFDGSWVRICVNLTLQIARALEHAHAQGVLHRDVKPSNVMLAADGRARLLDFGLAVGQGASRLTRSGAQVGSLPYMPPEVVAGKIADIDARTDVYSLGITFYELLTLRQPYSGRSPVELMRAIEAARPDSPERWNSEVGWEVATCCLTAMEGDPARRYPSAAAFARDLEHILALRPIEARRTSVWLRTKRWTQRNPAWTVAGACGVLLIVGGPLLYARQERNARKAVEVANAATERVNKDLESALVKVSAESKRAETNLDEALSAVAVMLQELGDDRLAGVPQADRVRGQMLRKAVEFYRRLAEQRKDDPRMSIRLSRGLSSVGLFQMRLRQLDEALVSQHETLAILERVALMSPEDCPEARELIAWNLVTLANVHQFRGNVQAAEQAYRLAALEYEGVRELAPAPQRIQSSLSTVHYNHGILCKNGERFDEALELFERSAALKQELIEAQPSNALRLSSMALVLGEIGLVQRSLGQLENSRATLEAALEVWEQAIAWQPQDSELASEMAKTRIDAGETAFACRDVSQAREYARAAVEQLRQTCADFPDVPFYRQLYVSALSFEALVLMELGQIAPAVENVNLAVPMARAQRQTDAQSANSAMALFRALHVRARAIAKSGDNAAALESWQEAWNVQKELCERWPDVKDESGHLEDARAGLSAALRNAGRLEEAVAVETWRAKVANE